MIDITWNDPQPNEGCTSNSARKVGLFFGPDVTDTFLKQHKLDYIVRSHECKLDGFDLTHNQRVITIFSASSYYSADSNCGAYIKLTPELKPTFVQYISIGAIVRQLDFRQKLICKSPAIRSLCNRLKSQRNELEIEFKKYDRSHTGKISIKLYIVVKKNRLDHPY